MLERMAGGYGYRTNWAGQRFLPGYGLLRGVALRMTFAADELARGHINNELRQLLYLADSDQLGWKWKDSYAIH